MDYLNLEKYINMDRFMSLQEEIHTALVECRKLSTVGTWSRQLIDDKLSSRPKGFKTVQEAMSEFMALSNDNPVKIEGLKLYRENISVFTTYLKMAMQAYDPYRYYTLHGRVREQDQPLLEYMHNVLDWLKTDLKITVPIFAHLEKITFVVCEANGMSWDHVDLDSMNEFLYVRPNLEKPLYLWDPVNKTKTYVNSKAAMWDVNAWVGSEQIMKQSYYVKLEGIFTEYFRKKIASV